MESAVVVRPSAVRRVVLAAVIAVAAIALAWPPVAKAAQQPHLLDEECPAEFTVSGEIRGMEGQGFYLATTVFLHYADEGHTLFVRFCEGQGVVGRRKGRRTTLLASFAAPTDGEGVLRFAVKRRLWRITLICNERVLGDAYDTKMSGGHAGWSADSGLDVSLRLQPTEPVAFNDDFTRGPGEAPQWGTLAGRWVLGEVPAGNHEGQVGRFSPNAFSWEAQARPAALCTAGQWFWDDYAVEASVRPQSAVAVGIAAYVADDRNYLLFRFTAALPGVPGSGVCQLVRVQNGRGALLASARAGYQPGQWYRLRLIAWGRSLAAYIDGQLACLAYNDTFGQGRIGLYAERGLAGFDDVDVTAAVGFRETFTDAQPGKWEDSGIRWHTHVRHRCTCSDGEGITLTGRPDWQEYVLTADVCPRGADAVGLCFAWRDPRNYWLFRVPAGAVGKAALAQVRDGNMVVRAQSELPRAVGQRGTLAVRVDRCDVVGSLDGRALVRAVDAFGFAGRAGSYARGQAGARFANLVLRSLLWVPGAHWGWVRASSAGNRANRAAGGIRYAGQVSNRPWSGVHNA